MFLVIRVSGNYFQFPFYSIKSQFKLIIFSYSAIDHIAYPQNDAWWEGQGHRFRLFPSFPQCIKCIPHPSHHASKKSTITVNLRMYVLLVLPHIR